MKNTDLRIGNILAFVLPDSYCQIDYIERELIGSSPLGKGSEEFNAERSIDDFKPINLSQEWLLKLGFERVYYKDNPVWVNKSHYMFLNCSYHILIKESGFVAFMAFDCFLKQVQTVHELQNLYFALIGEELFIHSLAV